MIGHQLAPGATPVKPATARPSLPPLDSGNGVLMLHECQIQKREDEFAWVEQYLVRCKCHMGERWQVWRPGDPTFICPEEGNRDTTHNMPTEDV